MKTLAITYEVNMSGGWDPLVGEVSLKACPFCGERDNIQLVNTHTASCWVECGNCDAQAQGRYFSTEKGTSTRDHYLLAIESAKDAWNRRIK
jgi:transcription elongation factor Elf1